MNKENTIFFFIFFSILLSNSFLCHSQTEKIEELLRQSKSGKDDSLKVITYLDLAWELVREEPQRARFYAERAEGLSRKIRYEKGLANSLDLIARCYSAENNFTEAIDYYLKSIKHFEVIKDNLGVASVYQDLGVIALNQGNYQASLEYFSNSAKKYEGINDKEQAANAYSNLGVVSRKQGNFQQAIEYYIKALKILEELQDNVGVAFAKGNLGNLFRDQENYERALLYYFQTMELFQVLENRMGLATTLNNIGIAYKNQKKYIEALSYYSQALELSKELDWKVGMASCYSNLGSIYNDQLNFNASLENNRMALKIFEELENKEAVSGRYSEIGAVLTKTGSFDEAFENLMLGLEIAKEIGNKARELESYEVIFKYFEAIKDYKSSLAFYKMYSVTKDSIFNIEKSHQLAEIETRYEMDKKEQENELLRKEQAVKNALIDKKDFENNALISGILLFFIFTGYFYFHNIQKKKINKLLSLQNEEIHKKQDEIIKVNADLQKSQDQLSRLNKTLQKLNSGLEILVKERTAALQQINEELDTFLYQSSHALRRPIVTVMGLLQIARMEKSKKNLGDIYNKIDNTANRMDIMLRKLVMVSEINFSKSEVEYIDFETVINEIWNSLSNGLKVGTMAFNLTVKQDSNYMADKKLVWMMLENIIENSILYHIEAHNFQPFLQINVVSNSTTVNIEVQDNGIGIPEQSIDKVFEMFTVSNDIGKGFGLGLYIVKKTITNLNGSISVKSKQNQLTTFSIVLPKHNISVG